MFINFLRVLDLNYKFMIRSKVIISYLVKYYMYMIDCEGNSNESVCFHATHINICVKVIT